MKPIKNPKNVLITVIFVVILMLFLFNLMIF